jgi:hypothetical protein
MQRAECELVGALIGDGYLYTNKGKYVVGFTGQPETDKEYFEYLRRLINKVWQKEPQVKTRAGGLRIRFNSKPVIERLTKYFQLPTGKGKGEKVTLPKVIIDDWRLTRACLRGIFDTDGSIFTADKPGSPNYPSIEITTTSKQLAEQVKTMLESEGFRVAKIWQYQSKLSKRPAYKVPLNGWKNLEKWLETIGMSNPYKYQRAVEAIEKKW